MKDDSLQQDLCDVFCSDEAKVLKVKSRIGEVAGLADLFKTLSDETRLKIVYGLLLEELCVCDLANVLGMSAQAVSHHLRVLRAARLVRYRRDGKMVFYSLDDEHVAHLIGDGLSHLREEAGRL